jgi:hypothetical protein
MHNFQLHLALFLCCFVVGAATVTGAQPDMAARVTPFLKEHCNDCHTGEKPAGGLDLKKQGTDLDNPDVLRRWVQIHDRVAAGEMPPKEEPRPGVKESQVFLSNLSTALTSADKQRRRVVLRRLNRVEYENTIRDLFGIRVDLKDMLPQDPAAHGFDTVGEVLAISPEQMEVYLQAASKALDQVFGPDKEPKRVTAKMPLGRDEFASRAIGQLFVKTEDESLVTFQGHWCPSVFLSGQAKVDGTYRVRIKAKAYQTDKPVIMAVYGGDVIVGRLPTHLVGYYDVAPGEEWTEVAFEDWLEMYGCYQMKPYNLSAPTQGPDKFKGAGLMIGEVSVEGPLEAWPPPSRMKLLGAVDVNKGTLADAEEIFSRLLPRAFRRKVQPEEVKRYVELTKKALDDKRPFIDALRVGLLGILCSPEFLLREEPAGDGKEAEAISDHALASRLSYFLWSSMPDDELLAIADQGKLSEPAVLRGQVDRLLRDSKGDRFVKNFTGQWLKLREIDFTEPDARQYPEFDEMLRYSMLRETERFFREVLDHDQPLLDFVDSDWTILNERLARHYGVGGVTGQHFRRVALPAGSPRGGVLTQASILKVTANGTNTSPVIRGVWVLENILGKPVPPPPPGIGAIEPDIRGATTIRQQLDKHRNTESCSVCHKRIDPPGFALESFDAIGGWRDWYRSLGAGERVDLEIGRIRVQYKKGPPVDPSGSMAGGQEFADIRQFKELLLEDKDQIARCLTEKLVTYGLGRGLGFADRPAIGEIVKNVSGKEYGFRSLVHEVVLSKTFRQK